MAAKGRKPAITGIARPEGIIDDVIIPLGRKAVKNVTGRKASKTQAAGAAAARRKKAFETMSKAPGPVKQYKTDAELARIIAKSRRLRNK